MNPIRRSRLVTLALALGVIAGSFTCARSVTAQPPDSDGGQQFLRFVQTQAAAIHAEEQPPATMAAWQTKRKELRDHLLAAWGGFPAEPCAQDARKLGELQCEGYRVEKIIFQTRPGIWMTANAYVPDRAGKLPAVLCVHGHWRGAKQDPVVQSRCIGLAKHGFFVLVVDAFGAGERALGKQLGEYHGEMAGATLLPIGLPLSGLQVYENMRAVDYLRSRTEVDGEKIGITGASGGGNQSMYSGAWDERIAAVTPVCSVGTYQAYLGAACCMCEVVPGAARFTQEWGVLALTAPRGLMIVNATRDAHQFSVDEAKKSLALVEPIYRLHDRPGNVQHAIFESPHDYSRAMREAMYGWMSKHLAGRGDGSPLPEPEIKTEDPESLRCYPGDSRPDEFVTLPKFAAQEAERLERSRTLSTSAAEWRATAANLRSVLRNKVLGGDPPPAKLHVRITQGDSAANRWVHFDPEPGLTIAARQDTGRHDRLVIVLHLDGEAQAANHPVTTSLREAGHRIVTLELRATGRFGNPADKIGRAPDHNTAEWAMWIGRPLLGQWVTDVRRCLDALRELDGNLPHDIAVVGIGPAGLAAICAAALDERFDRVAMLGSLASYKTDVPYEGQRLGILAPGILRDVGDVSLLAALVLPRRVVISGAVSSSNVALNEAALDNVFATTRQIAERLGACSGLSVTDEVDLAALAGAFVR